MANSASAMKRVRQNEKRRLRNRVVHGSYRNAVAAAREAIAGGSDQAATLVAEARRQLDRAVTKGVLHRSTASRRISRLAKALANN
ncbi:MAG: 30S ribosomal protein S20 [Myxococcales bacterium]|nr:30S ribosomal protein S20 [Myxococcales bacterium]